jgi:prepilin peptidase dependent protein B
MTPSLRAPARRHAAARRQRGLSMVELMVAVTVGLIVLTGVTAMMVNSLQSANDTMRAARLNQELRAVMDLIVRDLRRAGYRGDYASYFGLLAAGQTFSNTVAVSAGGSQLQFSYDLDADGAFSVAETFGYRRSGTSVQALRNGNWVTLTNAGTTQVTALSFCFAPSEDTDCLAAPPAASQVTITGGTINVIVKDVRITLTGRAADDASIERTLRETVRVRNDEVVNPAP